MTKQEVLDEVTRRLGIAPLRVSSGSTEPKEFFVQIVKLLGLSVSLDLDKPTLARSIVEGAGFPWHPQHESRGSTVTLDGLMAVRDAVFFLIPQDRI